MENSDAKEVMEEVLMKQIYFIRGQKVMLDRDLALLYDVETKALKQAVKRNLERFPEDFMFELDHKEFFDWRSQFVTSSRDKQGLRYAPFAFTEQGVAMLSSVLSSKKAVQINIQIIRVFTKLRQLLSDQTEVKLEIAEIKQVVQKMLIRQDGQDKNIELLFTYIDRLQQKIEQPKQTQRKALGYEIGNKE